MLKLLHLLPAGEQTGFGNFALNPSSLPLHKPLWEAPQRQSSRASDEGASRAEAPAQLWGGLMHNQPTKYPVCWTPC